MATIWDLSGSFSPDVEFAALDLLTGPGSQYGMGHYGLGHYSRTSAQTYDFSGNITAGTTFAADLTVSVGIPLAGDLSPVVNFSGNLVVDKLITGDLAPSVVFSGDISIVGIDDLKGDMSPVVTFSGTMGFDYVLGGGDIAPQITFAASLEVLLGFEGDLATFIDLEGDLTFEFEIDGDLPFTVIFAATTMTVGPLWGTTEPCPPPMWTDDEPCAPVEWEKTELCNG